MDKFRNASGKNESSNRKRFSLLISLYSTWKRYRKYAGAEQPMLQLWLGLSQEGKFAWL